MLALDAELTALGEPQILRGERRVLEPCSERRQALERAREVVADRLGLEVAVDPQDGLEPLDRQRLADSLLEPLDELVEAVRRQAEAGGRLVPAVALEHVVAGLQRAEQVEARDAAARSR